MTALAAGLRYVDLRLSRRRGDRTLRRRRERQLADLARHARETVPYYRELFREAGLGDGGLRSTDDLRRLPVTTKADLVAAGRRALSSTWPPDELRTERTSGSTGRPMTVPLDPGAVALRRALFLRALREVGWRPGRRLLLLVDDPPREARPLLRWRYASIHDPAERHLAALRGFRPRVLYGPMTALRRLADALDDAGEAPPEGLDLVVPTAETLDPATRRRLTRAFGADVRQLYGTTETGIVGWECGRGPGLHLAEDVLVLEFPEAAAGSDARARRLVVTHLGLRSMPLLRYDTGDLAVPMGAGACGCGCRFARVEAIAGRRVDCVRLPGGRVVSPYLLTRDLERVEGLERYQVVQRAPDRLRVRAAAPGADPADLERRIRDALAGTLGPEVAVEVEPARARDLDPPAGEKFRVVSSEVRPEGAAARREAPA